MLGAVEVIIGDRARPIARRRERCLLGLLLLEAGRVVPVDRLIELLWEQAAPAYARRTVHSHIARLRAVLTTAGGAAQLTTSGAGYLLKVDPDLIDIHRFRRLVNESVATADPAVRIDLLDAAAQLWRGPLLGDDADPLLRERVASEFDALWLRAQEQRMAALVHLGRHQEALPTLARLTAEQPAQERFAELYMTGLYRAGRKAEALSTYERTRSWLVEHLGIDPTPALRRLHQAVLRDELEPPSLPPPAPAAPSRAATQVAGERQAREVPAELPAAVPGFVGRDSEMTRLDELLLAHDAGPAAAVVAVAGTAGVGKTALAVHFGHRVAARFPDGQLYVNLRGFEKAAPMSPLEALTRMLVALGVPAERIPAEKDAAAGLYRSALAGKRMFILLDNAGSAEQVRLLLPGTPDCLAVVTSRKRMTSLVANHGALHLALDRLRPDDARELLVAMLGQTRVAAELAAALELTRLCAYLPLALRVAAASLATRPQWAITEYVDQLRGDPGMLQMDTESAVSAALELSYTRLLPAARRLFRLLALAPGPDITAEAAAALADVDTATASRTLEQLATAHLVEEGRPRRYGFHDLLRWHAGAKAEHEDNPAVRAAALERLATWYLKVTAGATQLAYPNIHRLPATAQWADRSKVVFGTAADATAWIDAECANLVATVVSVSERGPRGIAWLLTDALRGYFIYSGNLSDWLVTAHAALTAATQEGDLHGQASARLCMADLATVHSRYAEAMLHYDEAIVLSRRVGWMQGVGSAENNLSIVYCESGDEQGALTRLEAALAAYRAAGDVEGEAANANNLSQIFRCLGRLREAAEQAHRSLAFRSPSSPARSTALNNLAAAQHGLGDLDEALRNANDALDMRRRLGMPMAEAEALATISHIHRDSGRLDLALDAVTRAWRMVKDNANARARAEVRNALGTVYTRLGDYARATEAHLYVVDVGQQATIRYHETVALVGLGEAYLGWGRHEDARVYAGRALELAGKAGYQVLERRAHTVLAVADQTTGDEAHSAESAPDRSFGGSCRRAQRSLCEGPRGSGR
ncbi:SARP family transcriptional regulator [Phytohabitans aurantiacus]|uniref:SARP family transcriptional regulator n=1 Tax=Phytohabitans aurantiacus TaxID=3016789 RepID=A0ABQ5R997_9ACTN|nr:SARP family transcriptional regulator [Phytohabitans aurantiacus]